MSPKHPYQVIAYFPEWVYNRPYLVKHIAASGSAEKVTIINYAFGIPAPDPTTGQVICQIDNAHAAYAQVYSAEMAVDGQADDPNQPLRGHFNQLKKLKALYPHMRIVVSLGGWTGSGWFSVAARTAESREAFVRDCLQRWITGDLALVDGAGGPGAAAGVFDGIDLDWEYPVGDGLPDNHTDPADGENYVALLREFRKQYAAIGRPDLLLTMAGPGPGQARNYNLAEGHPLMDYISIMAYDFRGAYSKFTGHHTNLCTSDQDSVGRPVSGDMTVQVYRDEFGIPASKLVLGAAFYGKAWSQVENVNHGLYQPGKGLEGGGGDYRVLFGKTVLGYTRYWDAVANAPYLYSSQDKTFWTYDDPQSMALKAQYVRANGLGGMMFWEIAGDDERATLLSAIDQGLSESGPAENPCQ